VVADEAEYSIFFQSPAKSHPEASAWGGTLSLIAGAQFSDSSKMLLPGRELAHHDSWAEPQRAD